MCGIFGFIGESKNHEFTRNLCTVLFQKMQIRGTDASGFYCAKSYPSTNVAFYKKPVQATEFINTDEYKKIWENNLNIGIFHCRAASAGVGIPAFNENNHPFVSRNNKKALIHNGIIAKPEYEYLKSFYQLETECDSELLLRILEQEEDIFFKINRFVSYAKNSHFAVAFAEVENNFRYLHLFRNQHRPLVLIDMIEELGQIFFASTAEIFCESLDRVSKKNKNYKIYELPENNYASLSLDLSGDVGYAEYRMQEIEEITEKIEKFYSIKNENSPWNNLISSDNENQITDIIDGMLNKLKENCVNIQSGFVNFAPNADKNKINSIFNCIRDMNKKCDVIVKLLGE